MDATTSVTQGWDRLAAVLTPRQRVLTAYSGGIDSTLVAAMARKVLGRENAPAAIGDSPSLPRVELEEARALADKLDIELIQVQPREQDDPRYQANTGNRCYFCKSHLFDVLKNVARKREIIWIASGANADDLGDHRPGMTAAAEAQVINPLVEAAMGKSQVRALAQHLGLPNWDKPAAACLASRLPFGTPVTLQRLSQVEQAENALRDLGFSSFRVRHHEAVARLEIPWNQATRLTDSSCREAVIQAVKSAGYHFVALDLEGFRSGSGNVALGQVSQAKP